MCGRTACTLAPDIICRACTYKDPGGDGGDGGKYKKPRWREHPESKTGGPGAYQYYPTANAAPTRFTPVLIRSQQGDGDDKVKKEKEEETEEVNREVMPMMFGMVPFYHKGPPKSHGLTTNNCRLEGILESKLYKRCWAKRQFCVVLCQGFYEWKTAGVGEAKGLKRQPYLIYAPQKGDYSVVRGDQWENGKWTEESGWEGPELLKIAGLWDLWKDPESGEEVYSYTIITMESNDTLSWLHHRMPAILDTEEIVAKWLDGKGTDKELMELLKPVKMLKWHKVDGKVGNSRCQDKDCMEELKAGQVKSSFMDNWLKKGASGGVKVKKERDEDEEQEEKPEVKRAKKEEN